VSNVAIAEKDGSPTRVRIERRDDGRRMRVTKRSGTELD
jgi:ribosomal protein L24